MQSVVKLPLTSLKQNNAISLPNYIEVTIEDSIFNRWRTGCGSIFGINGFLGIENTDFFIDSAKNSRFP